MRDKILKNRQTPIQDWNAQKFRSHDWHKKCGGTDILCLNNARSLGFINIDIFMKFWTYYFKKTFLSKNSGTPITIVVFIGTIRSLIGKPLCVKLLSGTPTSNKGTTVIGISILNVVLRVLSNYFYCTTIDITRRTYENVRQISLFTNPNFQLKRIS